VALLDDGEAKASPGHERVGLAGRVANAAAWRSRLDSLAALMVMFKAKARPPREARRADTAER
jgi:hypothetical protein